MSDNVVNISPFRCICFQDGTWSLELYGWWFQICLCSLLGIWSNLTCILMDGFNQRRWIVCVKSNNEATSSSVCVLPLRWIRDDWRIFPIDQWLQAKFQLTLGKWCRCGVWRHLCGSCDVITWQCGNQHPVMHISWVRLHVQDTDRSIDLVTYVAIDLLIDILVYIYIYVYLSV